MAKQANHPRNTASHPELERRSFPGRVESRADAPNTLVGLAAPFYDGTPGTEYQLWPGVFERYMPGCFDTVAEEDVRCLYNHEDCELLGRTKSGTLTLNVTGRGLEYTCQLPDTGPGRDVAQLVGRGDITGSSAGFIVREERWVIQENADGSIKEIRELLKLSLFDVSPVTYPAYEGTEAATRGAGAVTTARAAYEAWHAGRDAHERAAMEMAAARLALAEAEAGDLTSPAPLA